MNFPVDPYCRVEIVFPSDMPLTTDLSYLLATGIISGNSLTPVIPASTTNTFTVDGCSTYTTLSAAVLSLSMYMVKNKGYV